MKIKNKIRLVLVLGIIMSLGGWWVFKISWKGGDFLIMEVGGGGVSLVNISPARAMINSLEIFGEVDLWIPNGMGYYPASKLELILEDEGKETNLGKMTAFYNFGFWPDVVKSGEDWRSNGWLWENLGPLGWLRFRLGADGRLQKTDYINRQLPLERENLEEIMPRDMADNEVIEKNVRLTVVNASGENGLGNMVADRLGWWGGVVTAVDTWEENEECWVGYNGQVEGEKDVAVELGGILSCQLKEKGEGGVEVVLGRKLERMIKYSETYVRTF